MLKIAVDMGTSVTKIFRLGSGVVLCEPSCVAVDAPTGTIKAIGTEAKRLVGKTAEYTKTVFPVYEGEIVDPKAAVAMLDEFLCKIGVKSGRYRAEVLFCVPCGASEKAKSAVYNVCDELGISRIDFVEAPYLSALGQNLPVSDSNPVFVMDIGAGTTNIAVISLDGIIAGLSVNVGGSNMDAHIIDTIAETFALKIGQQTSERLKNTVGSLEAGDERKTVIDGRDMATGRPRSVSVRSADIVFPVQAYIDKILEYAERLLQKLPAEVSAGICRSGVHLSGGVCNVAGVADYIGERLGMEAHTAEEPQMAIVLGGGAAIGNPSVLKKIKLDF